MPLLIGYYGFDNKGDDWTLEQLLTQLNSCCTVAYNPKKIARNTQQYINRWNLFSLIKSLIKNNVVIFGGGELFQIKTSISSFFYYFLILKIAQIFNKNVYLLFQGFSEINNILIKNIFVNALKNTKTIIIARDHVSSCF